MVSLFSQDAIVALDNQVFHSIVNNAGILLTGGIEMGSQEGDSVEDYRSYEC